MASLDRIIPAPVDPHTERTLKDLALRVFVLFDLSGVVRIDFLLDEDTGEVLERVENIAIYIHQLAMDPNGDLYTASVYPEHAGEKRGPEGPRPVRRSCQCLAAY